MSVSHNSSGGGGCKNQHQAAMGLSVELHILHRGPRPVGQLDTIFPYLHVSASRKDVPFVLWQLQTRCPHQESQAQANNRNRASGFVSDTELFHRPPASTSFSCSSRLHLTFDGCHC